MIREEKKIVYICNFCGEEDDRSALTIKINLKEFHLCSICWDAVEQKLKDIG